MTPAIIAIGPLDVRAIGGRRLGTGLGVTLTVELTVHISLTSLRG